MIDLIFRSRSVLDSTNSTLPREKSDDADFVCGCSPRKLHHAAAFISHLKRLESLLKREFEDMLDYAKRYLSLSRGGYSTIYINFIIARTLLSGKIS